MAAGVFQHCDGEEANRRSDIHSHNNYDKRHKAEPSDNRLILAHHVSSGEHKGRCAPDAGLVFFLIKFHHMFTLRLTCGEH